MVISNDFSIFVKNTFMEALYISLFISILALAFFYIGSSKPLYIRDCLLIVIFTLIPILNVVALFIAVVMALEKLGMLGKLESLWQRILKIRIK